MKNCVSNVAPTCDTTPSAIVTPWKIRRSLDLIGSKSMYFSTSGGTTNGRRLGEAHCADISTRCVVVVERTSCRKRRFFSPGVLCVSSIRPCSMMEHYWRMHGYHERWHLFRGRGAELFERNKSCGGYHGGVGEGERSEMSRGESQRLKRTVWMTTRKARGGFVVAFIRNAKARAGLPLGSLRSLCVTTRWRVLRLSIECPVPLRL